MRKKSSPSDRDLDPESIKRRTELFTQLVLPHKGMIYDICINYSYQKNQIADNYNNTLIALYRFIESYNPNKCIKNWIYVVTVRVVLDVNNLLKKMQINENISVESIESEMGCHGVSCNWLGLDNYREHYNDDILEAIDSLTPKYKEVLLLQQAGYCIEEIVDITFQNGSLKSKNAETVKSRIFLAKRQLKKLITPKGEKRTKTYEQKNKSTKRRIPIRALRNGDEK